MNSAPFKEVIVVEGNHDAARIKQIYPNANTVITNGSEIPKDTLQLLKKLQKERGLILMLDPDYPGERIRHQINAYVGPTKHVFLPKHKCISENKQKIGIEHADQETIQQALKMHVHNSTQTSTHITIKDMIALRLTITSDAKARRRKVCDAFYLGLCNAKTLRNRLNMFAITKEAIEEVLK